MKRVWWVIMLLGWLPDAHAQSHGGANQYCSLQDGKSFLVTPVVYYQSNRNWYVEGRYNYEAQQTLSLYAGKTFATKGPVSLAVSPVVGVVAGQFNGGSAGANINFDWKQFFLSSQLQYTFSVQDRKEDFVYSWSDAGYNFLPALSAGFSLQQSKFYKVAGTLTKGIFLQAAYKNWTVPIYLFSPGKKDRYFVLGLNCEWQYKKKAVFIK